jgi:hypothetical protein
MKQKGPLTSGNEGDEAMAGTPKMLYVRRLLTAGLTGIAFWNSYEHTVDWFRENGQAGAAGALALIPEVGVFLVILSLALDHLTRPQKVVLGFVALGSVSVTLTGNLAGAGPGVFGVCAALVAPLFAIAGFALELMGESAPSQRESKAAQAPARPAQAMTHSGSCAPTGDLGLMVVSRDGSLRDPWAQPEPEREPVAWTPESVKRLSAEDGLSTAEIVSRTGLSKATVNRWKAA